MTASGTHVGLNQNFARGVIARVALCLKVATVHQLSNAAVRPAMRSLLDLINPSLTRGETVQLQTVGENLFLNHEPVRLDNSTYEAAELLRSIFKRLGIQELSFTEPLNEEELREFLAGFQRHFQGGSPSQILDERFSRVSLRTLENVTGQRGASNAAERLMLAYAQFTLVLDRTTAQLQAGKDPRLARLRRALQLLVDAVQGHESLLVAVTQLPRETASTSAHLASATALTLLLGRRLGLSRAALIETALAASFHDFARGPLDTVLPLTQWSGMPVMLQCAAVAFEHRAPLQPQQPAAISRLVSVACAYDLLLHPAPPRAGFMPPQALDVIRSCVGTRFDPLVVRALASAVGVYPPGTLVALTNGTMAVVVDRPNRDDLLRTRVRLQPSGAPMPSDWVIDLADPTQNRDRLQIAGVLDAKAMHVNTLECLFLSEELG